MSRLKDIKQYMSENDLLFPEVRAGSFESTVNKAYQMVCAHARIIANQRRAYYDENGIQPEDAMERSKKSFDAAMKIAMLKFASAQPKDRLLDYAKRDVNDILLTPEFFQLGDNAERFSNPFARRDFANGRFKFGYVKRRHFNFEKARSREACAVVISKPLTINGWEEGLAWLKAEWALEVEAAMATDHADTPTCEDWRKFPAESKVLARSSTGGDHDGDEEEESLD